MKVRALEVYPVRAEVRPYASSAAVAPFAARSDVLVRVVGEDGLDGWGETGLVPIRTFATGIAEVLAPRVVGSDPQAPLRILHDMQFALRGWRHGFSRAVGAVEMALWDLKGKIETSPVCAFFGATPEGRYPVVGEALFYESADPSALDPRVARAEEWAARGYRAIKIKIGGLPPDEDLAHVRAISEAVGPNVAVAVDANMAYSLRSARSVGERLADLGVFWFEEPLPIDDAAGYADVAAHSRGVLIAGGQTLPSPEAFMPLLEARGLHLVQPSVSSVGGISENVRLMGLARAFGVRWSPRHAGTGLFSAAALHLRAVASGAFDSPFPDWDWMEWDANPNPIRDVVVDAPEPDADGFLAVPTGHGLGVTVDLDAVKRLAAA